VMFAALVAAATASSTVPPAARVTAATEALAAVARGASPRVEIAGPGVVVIDARGLTRLFGQEAQVAALCRQQAADRGVAAAVAMASTRTAALLLALRGAERIAAAARDASNAAATVPTVIVPAGAEAAALAPLPIALVARLAALDTPARPRVRAARSRSRTAGTDAGADVPLALWRRWGLATLGALAALPAADLFERLGAAGLAWHAMARGLDARPLVPTAEPQPFEATCAFEWPIEAIEPLSFALGRVIDPLCARLDHDGLGTVTLQTTLRLVTRELYVRRLGLPMPMRDPKVLRTLIVLDLESHPPPAGIDVLTVTFEPVAGRIVQPSLLARAHPRPETIATLTARLRAVMGDGKVGSPVALDTHRGGAIGMRPFDGPVTGLPLAVAETPATTERDPAGARLTLRRFRPPPPVRVELDRGRPVRVQSFEPRRLPRLGVRGESAASHRDGRGVRRMQRDVHHGLLGAVRQSAGPWRSSGDWWRVENAAASPSVWQPDPSVWSDEPTTAWDEDEWDVVLESGTALRLARDRRCDTWVVTALID
jgi:protein ImuB